MHVVFLLLCLAEHNDLLVCFSPLLIQLFWTRMHFRFLQDAETFHAVCDGCLTPRTMTEAGFVFLNPRSFSCAGLQIQSCVADAITSV